MGATGRWDKGLSVPALRRKPETNNRLKARAGTFTAARLGTARQP
jgi:hypothetical protein